MIDPTFSLFSTDLIVVSVVFPLISTLFIALRFYVRRSTQQGLGADDWTALASLILCWILGVNMWVFAAVIGINRIHEDPRSATLDTYKFFWANEIPFTLVLGSTKVSVLLFYHRLFPIALWRKVSWAMITIVSLWTVAILIVSIFKTTPISGIWTDPEHTYNIDETTYSLVVAGMSLGFDVIILSMPVFVIRTLHMPRARKIAVVFIFWLGALCCVCSAVRLALLYQSLYAVSQNPNLYATLTTMMIWAEAEPNVSVVAASLPMLRPLVSSGNESFIKPWFSTLGSRFRSSRLSSRGDSKLENGYSYDSATPSGDRVSGDNGSTTRLHQDVELGRV